MKLKMKLMAAAVALAAASGANAATIDNGAGGNGGLFFNVWDATGSYTRNLGISLNTFESDVAAGTAISTYAADANLTSFLTGKTAVSWNIMAIDNQGAVRILESAASGAAITAKTATVLRSDAGYGQTFANNVNLKLSAVTDSAIFATTDTGYAFYGTTTSTIGAVPKINASLGFSSFGSLANNSAATALNLIEANGAASGAALGTYPISANANGRTLVYLDGNDALHLSVAQPVPEPESYALMLAGLGMLGFMARRRIGNNA